MERPFCEVLAWDSEFFGRRIGRIVPIEAKGGRLDRALLAEVDAWCSAEAIDCLYFLADSGDPATAAVAEAGGFRLVDLRVTLEGRPGGHPEGEFRAGRIWAGESSSLPDPSARPSLQDDRTRLFFPEDLADLRRIAAASHHDSRFYADPHFDRERCDELYATWIEKSCRGESADAVLVAEHEGKPAGYISCVRSGGVGDSGEIGLIAVAAEAQGRGLGKALIRASLRWFADRGLSRVRVVTQGRNVRAQRLYQAHGLFTRSIGLWFHRWETP
jgi:dTDP-4-amino-4,6-dideoxy-D-galactose acyltransferase